MSGTLIVFDGAFGFSKRHLQNYTGSHSQINAEMMKKYTIVGHEVGLCDKISVDLDEVVDVDAWKKIKADPKSYHYELTGQEYAFHQDDLARRLDQVAQLFLVVRDLQTIRKLKEDFAGRAVSVFIYTERSRLESEMRGEVSGEQLAFHLKRHDEAWDDFTHHRRHYDHVLINRGEEMEIYRQLSGIIQMVRTASSLL